MSAVDKSSIFDGLKAEDYNKESMASQNEISGQAPTVAKMIYEYKTAKRVDNTVSADLSKLKGRSVVVTGGTSVYLLCLTFSQL